MGSMPTASGRRRDSSTNTSRRRCRRCRSRPASRCAPPSTGCPWGWSPTWMRGCGCWVPPTAQPVGGILAGQAVRHVLSARRWDEVSPDMRDYLSGIYGNPPQEIAPAAAVHADPFAAVDPSPDLDQIRAEGLAASEEDLLLVALFGDDASRLLATLRGRGDREDAGRDGLERSQSERIRELIEMVEGSDVG